MDFDNESLLKCFLPEEGDDQRIKDWCEENDHKRSDIFEYRLAKADKLREEGNELYKSGDYETARQRYLAAVWHLDFDIGQQWNMMDKHQNDLNTRKLKAIGNICAAYLKSKDWVQTKRAADIGLRHMEKAELKDPDAEAKFLYRKGVANMERGFHEDAYEAFKKAEAAKPGEAEVRKALREADRGQKEDRKKVKEQFRGKLLTEEEKACQGDWWLPATQWARCKRRCRHLVGPRKIA